MPLLLNRQLNTQTQAGLAEKINDELQISNCGKPLACHFIKDNGAKRLHSSTFDVGRSMFDVHFLFFF